MLNTIIGRHTRKLCCALMPFLFDAVGYGQIATRDGLRLELDDAGAVRSCRVGDRELLRTGQRGGFFIADVSDVSALEVNVLGNPSFEQMQGGRPAEWVTGDGWSVNTGVARSGKMSMKVEVPGEKKRSTGNLAVEIPVRPNTPYRVSMWLRTQGGAPHLYVEQLDGEGRPHRDYPQLCVSHARRESDWFEVGRSLTTAFFCRRIRVRTNLWQQTGTAWVDDVSVICLDDDYVSPQQLAEGKVRRTADAVTQECDSLADMHLRFRATYRAEPDYLAIDGEIEDTSGRDRAVSVSFRLPMGDVGWRWFDDIQNEQVIEKGVRYGSARLLGQQDPRQRRTMALYPFSAMGDGTTALALAVPMDMPRAFRLCYDAELGYFVNYELGLTRATAKFPGKAWFRFFIYRVDPQWGFRAAAKRYYECHPQFFVKRAERDGSIGSMADCDAAPAAEVVAPAFADFNWHRRQLAAGNHRELTKLLRYTEFIGWWGWAIGIKPKQAEKKPTPEEAWAHVEKLAHADPPHQVARCILNCALHDRDGKRRLHRGYVPRWGGHNYLCNPDPEIMGLGGKVSRFTLTYQREVAEVDTFKLDGMRFDNPCVFATDNFRREHFQWADHPLVFDHVSKKPVLPLDFSSFECAQAIADDMHSRGKIVGSNYTPVAYPSDIFRIQLLDVIGSETLWTWPTNAKLALQRALAGQKIVSMSWQEAKKTWPAERIEREMKQAMFYGTFYYLSTMNPDLQARWGRVTARLASAGWEPLTHAQCPALGPMVERFGNCADRDLHFTLRNESVEAKPVELSIDAEALGLHATPKPSVWLMHGPLELERLDADQSAPQCRVRLTLPPRDTIAIRVATPFGLALDHLFGVPDRLRRAANYRRALEEAGAEVVCPDCEPIVKDVGGGVAQLLSRSPDSGAIRAELESLAAALPNPVVTLRAEAPKVWATRLQANIARARSGLQQAATVCGPER